MILKKRKQRKTALIEQINKCVGNQGPSTYFGLQVQKLIREEIQNKTENLK